MGFGLLALALSTTDGFTNGGRLSHVRSMPTSPRHLVEQRDAVLARRGLTLTASFGARVRCAALAVRGGDIGDAGLRRLRRTGGLAHSVFFMCTSSGSSSKSSGSGTAISS